MRKLRCMALASTSVLLSLQLQAAHYADSVVAYSPGTGYATDFGTGEGFIDPAAALGEPSRSTPGQFGGPVDPFNPPYLKTQLVSIGAGGSLTVGFDRPIVDSPDNPLGLDFLIYGNSGFIITNGDFSGGGRTDGELFGAANPGSTRVFVSSDNIDYFELNPARAPVVDGLFPTDGSGAFGLPVNPALGGEDFAGAGLAELRGFYNGSAGGAGFDIAWAQDGSGQSITLPDVRFIRVDVLNGAAEIDGFAAPNVVPEPGSGILLALAVIGLFAVGRRRLSSGRVDQAAV